MLADFNEEPAYVWLVQVEPTVRRADQSFLWMTTEQAVGTCINVDDEQLLWKNLQPTPLVKNEVIRIQSQQLGCSVGLLGQRCLRIDCMLGIQLKGDIGLVQTH